MVRISMEREVPETPDSATRLKLGILRRLIRSLITQLDILESNSLPTNTGFNSEGVDFYEEVKRFEVQLIHEALTTAGGTQQKAAQLLKLNLTTLNSKIKRYGIPWRSAKVGAEAERLTSRCEELTHQQHGS